MINTNLKSSNVSDESWDRALIDAQQVTVFQPIIESYPTSNIFNNALYYIHSHEPNANMISSMPIYSTPITYTPYAPPVPYYIKNKNYTNTNRNNNSNNKFNINISKQISLISIEITVSYFGGMFHSNRIGNIFKYNMIRTIYDNDICLIGN